MALSRHFGEGAMIYKHACALDCEGIVSIALPGWTITSLAENQEPKRAGKCGASKWKISDECSRRLEQPLATFWSVKGRRVPHFKPGKPMHERLNGVSAE